MVLQKVTEVSYKSKNPGANPSPGHEKGSCGLPTHPHPVTTSWKMTHSLRLCISRRSLTALHFCSSILRKKWPSFYQSHIIDVQKRNPGRGRRPRDDQLIMQVIISWYSESDQSGNSLNGDKPATESSEGQDWWDGSMGKSAHHWAWWKERSGSLKLSSDLLSATPAHILPSPNK